MRILLPLAVLALSSPAAAQERPAPPPEDRTGHPAFEINVLWPFVPGGITEMKFLVPVVRRDQRDFRGELLLGAYSDFANRIVRDERHGKVATLSAKIGWRQFFVYGLHAEVVANLGWRQEKDNVYDHTTLDAFVGRLWMMAGWQFDVNDRVYLNLRGGIGVHMFRTDRFADKERRLTGGGDVNLGFRF